MDSETVATARTAKATVTWDDVDAVAWELFHTWGGGDLQWAKAAWRALDRAGLTSYSTEEEHARCVVRLGTLNALYREFCVRAFGEGSSGEWQDEVPAALKDEFPWVDLFTVDLADEEDNPDGEWEFEPSEVINELIHEEHSAVVNGLREQWDENELLTSLHVSTHGSKYIDAEAASPVTPDKIHSVLGGDRHSANLHTAYEWFTDGMSL